MTMNECPTCHRDRKPTDESCWWCGMQYMAESPSEPAVSAQWKEWYKIVAAAQAKIVAEQQRWKDSIKVTADVPIRLPQHPPEMPAGTYFRRVGANEAHTLNSEGYTLVAYDPLHLIYTWAKVPDKTVVNGIAYYT